MVGAWASGLKGIHPMDLHSFCSSRGLQFAQLGREGLPCIGSSTWMALWQPPLGKYCHQGFFVVLFIRLYPIGQLSLLPSWLDLLSHDADGSVSCSSAAVTHCGAKSTCRPRLACRLQVAPQAAQTGIGLVFFPDSDRAATPCGQPCN